MLPTRIHSSERLVGRRATFHVYYTDGKGRRRFDASWAKTPDGAVSQICGSLKTLRDAATDVKVVACEGGLV